LTWGGGGTETQAHLFYTSCPRMIFLTDHRCAGRRWESSFCSPNPSSATPGVPIASLHRHQRGGTVLVTVMTDGMSGSSFPSEMTPRGMGRMTPPPVRLYRLSSVCECVWMRVSWGEGAMMFMMMGWVCPRPFWQKMVCEHHAMMVVPGCMPSGMKYGTPMGSFMTAWMV